MTRSTCLSFLALSLVLANLQPPQALAQAQDASGGVRVSSMGKNRIEMPLKSLINPAYPVSALKKPRASGRVVAGSNPTTTADPSSVGTQPVPFRRPMAFNKLAIETPLKSTINPTYGTPRLTAPTQPLTLAPARRLTSPLKKTTPAPALRSAARTAIDEQVVGVDANGIAKVAPGMVNWHGNFELARAASAVSGKPVLQFAMIGNLDDKFC